MGTKVAYPVSVSSVPPSFSLWASNNSGTKWGDVDDPVGSPDDTTTSVILTGQSGTKFEYYGIGSLAAIPADITGIDKIGITARWRCTTGTSYQARIGLLHNDNGAAHDVSASSLTSAYQNFTIEWLTNPATGAAWTRAELVNRTDANDLLEIGVRAYANSRVYTLTQIYITVTYTGGTEAATFKAAWAVGQSGMIGGR